jgi:hypothetical protein
MVKTDKLFSYFEAKKVRKLRKREKCTSPRCALSFASGRITSIDRFTHYTSLSQFCRNYLFLFVSAKLSVDADVSRNIPSNPSTRPGGVLMGDLIGLKSPHIHTFSHPIHQKRHTLTS